MSGRNRQPSKREVVVKIIPGDSRAAKREVVLKIIPGGRRAAKREVPVKIIPRRHPTNSEDSINLLVSESKFKCLFRLVMQKCLASTKNVEVKAIIQHLKLVQRCPY